MNMNLLILTCVFSREPRKKRLEIHLVHFTTGSCHELAAAPVIYLEFEGKYDRSFGTHIELMGGYLVVLIAHGSLFRNYQSLYLVDWIQGHLICVSTPLRFFDRDESPFFTSSSHHLPAPAREWGHILPCPDFHIRGYLGSGT
jgi:hypothetical protein